MEDSSQQEWNKTGVEMDTALSNVYQLDTGTSNSYLRKYVPLKVFSSLHKF